MIEWISAGFMKHGFSAFWMSWNSCGLQYSIVVVVTLMWRICMSLIVMVLSVRIISYNIVLLRKMLKYSLLYGLVSEHSRYNVSSV